MNILDLIPPGKENAVTRKRLCELTGLPDRENRKLIEIARRTTPIIARKDGGYYQPEENELHEVVEWLGQETARAISITEAKKGAQEWLYKTMMERKVPGC